MAHGKSPGKTRPISRSLPPIALCECRNRVKGMTFAPGERLEWPLLLQKTLRVFPRFSNPLTPCDWGQRETKTDASGHTWEVHHLEIKECLPAPSHTPLAPGVAPQVMLRGESATRMSDALESMMQFLINCLMIGDPALEFTSFLFVLSIFLLLRVVAQCVGFLGRISDG
ncbi:hypothetical protein D6D29_05409 [Aureobasidium pullulans]|nr:hypothetical protein D6D29_05409 [Aureobasidium pullulans]